MVVSLKNKPKYNIKGPELNWTYRQILLSILSAFAATQIDGNHTIINFKFMAKDPIVMSKNLKLRLFQFDFTQKN